MITKHYDVLVTPADKAGNKLNYNPNKKKKKQSEFDEITEITEVDDLSVN